MVVVGFPPRSMTSLMPFFYLLQLNIVYNVNSSDSFRSRRSIENKEAFDLEIDVNDEEDDVNHMNLNVCTR